MKEDQSTKMWFVAVAILFTTQAEAFTEAGVHYGSRKNDGNNDTRLAQYFISRTLSPVAVHGPMNELLFLEPRSAVSLSYSKESNEPGSDQISEYTYGFTYVNNGKKIILELIGGSSQYLESDVTSHSKNIDVRMGLTMGKGKWLYIGREFSDFDQASNYDEEAEQFVSYRQFNTYSADTSFVISAYYSDTSLKLNSGLATKSMTKIGISTDFYLSPQLGIHISTMDFDGDSYYKDGNKMTLGASYFLGKSVKFMLTHVKSSGDNIRNPTGRALIFAISVRPEFF